MDLSKKDQQEQSADKSTSIRRYISNKADAAKEKITNAIDDGTGNEVINASQDIINHLIVSPFDACKVLSRQVLFMSRKQRQSVIKQGYIIATIATLVAALSIVFDFTLAGLVHCVTFLPAAFILDILIRKGESKTTVVQPSASAKPQKRAQKQVDSEDDFLI